MIQTSAIFIWAGSFTAGSTLGYFLSPKMRVSKDTGIVIGGIVGFAAAYVTVQFLAEYRRKTEAENRKKLAEENKKKMIASGQMLADGTKAPGYNPTTGSTIAPIPRK